MTKSLLFSVIAIGVAVTVIGYAATQAAFTDSQTASGDVNAGTINLYLEEPAQDDNGENEFIFDVPAAENLLPGQFTTDTLRLTNTGTATFTIATASFSTSTGADCDPGNPGDEFVPSFSGFTPGVTTIAPGASLDAVVQVDLIAAAGNPCQGDVYNVQFVITVSS